MNPPYKSEFEKLIHITNLMAWLRYEGKNLADYLLDEELQKRMDLKWQQLKIAYDRNNIF